jgi:hypothetical protein
MAAAQRCSYLRHEFYLAVAVAAALQDCSLRLRRGPVKLGFAASLT